MAHQALQTETTSLHERAQRLEATLRSIIRGSDDVVRLALVAVFAKGHLLIEGVPGVGKTTLGHTLARALDCIFQRVQFTSDMLPSDLLGTSIYSAAEERFEFKPGPVFTNVLLADEINRTTPKTQSALLEVMNEGQVTVDGQARESEREILRAEAGAARLDEVRPVLSAGDVLEMQEQVKQIRVDESLINYMLEVVKRTRESEQLSLGVSPRGSLMLYRAAQAMAFVEGRSFTTPHDFKRLAVPVFAHRVVVNARYSSNLKASEQAERILAEIVDGVSVPA